MYVLTPYHKLVFRYLATLCRESSMRR